MSLSAALNRYRDGAPDSASLRSLHGALGRLASRWLSDDCLRRVGHFDTAARDSALPGEFLLLFARDGSSQVLREAFTLPVRWVPRKTSDPRLPQDLARLANDLIGKEKVEGFSLELGEHCPSLADFTATALPCESAGAILTATLRAVRHGGEIDPTISATASWNHEDGPGPVEGTDRKITEACAWGVAQVFVPKHDSTANAAAMRLGVGPSGVDALTRALNMPPVGQDLMTQSRWQEAASRQGHPRAISFYAQSLVEAIAADAHTRWVSKNPNAKLPVGGTLVISVSTQLEATLLSVAVHRPERLVILELPEPRGKPRGETEGLPATLRHLGVSCPMQMPRLGSIHPTPDDIAASLDGRLLAGRSVTVNVTPGPKDLALALYSWARHTGATTWITVQESDGGTPRIHPVTLLQVPQRHKRAEVDTVLRMHDLDLHGGGGTVDSGPVLVGVDVHGIQAYLFATSKLREIIGASRIIDDLTGADADDCPRRVLEQHLRLKRAGSSLPAARDWYLPVRLGGGVVRVILPNRTLAKQFVSGLSRWTIERATGLRLGASIEPFDLERGDLSTALGAVIKSIASAKMIEPAGCDFGGFPFTAPCVQTGDPAAGYGESGNERLCDASLDKRHYQAVSERGDRWSPLLKNAPILALPKLRSKAQPFIFDTEELGADQRGGAYMAILAIDLNNLGKRGVEAIGESRGLHAIDKYREFSERVSGACGDAFRCALEGMKQDSGFEFGVVSNFVHDTGYLPIRPLVFGGDDMTFVMDARLAAGFTRNMLAKLASSSFAAAAGIAYVKTKSPFSRGIALAESLVANAKGLGREKSSVDFLVCTGEVPDSVESGRDDRMRDGKLVLCRTPYTIEDFGRRLGDASQLAQLPRSHVRGAVDRYRVSLIDGKTALRDLQENLARGLGKAAHLSDRRCSELKAFLQDTFVAPSEETQRTAYLDCVDLMRFTARPDTEGS